MTRLTSIAKESVMKGSGGTMDTLNLYTPAGGLYDTHVTWEDIEEDMKRELKTKASFGPNRTAKDIGDGKGFMSKILLVNPDWQHKDKELPKVFIVKVSSVRCKVANIALLVLDFFEILIRFRIFFL
ncbi:unnamed protein product [Heligmosomoides polygyrus]|uniref:GST N-terminal domain-containing protein n=1 Tax=Heligmosomoides polygyrus TaxID=6339 RepID=A0A183FYU0_HELPZ|nr:unnamed protein product [Heligmosomoides polygyrus]